MPRSSESVAALASALAKAQAELANPEKSLTATIRSARPGEGERSFRYAPLASGLDIVRKTLGKYEIATVQTTAIEPLAGLVNLTTMLAHASGEWIASDWPVCPLAEAAHPQRMGAALTYARRYALFTLVGIAGEDDLDALDLCDPAPPGSPSMTDDLASTPREPRISRRPIGNGHARGMMRAEPRAVLDADQSAALRDRLLTEIGDISSTELAASWASAALSAKNSLKAGDAKVVEDAFEQRLSQLGSPSEAATSSGAHGSGPEAAVVESPQPPAKPEAKGIDKSALAVPAPRRYRDRDHLRHVAKQPCLICGRKPSDPHHLRYLQPRALGRKASDEFVVPLCRIHHRLVHRVGNEAAWWRDADIDPTAAARRLWKETRVDAGRAAPDTTAHGTAPDRTAGADGPAVTSQAPV
jgi:ERF superfamily